MKDTLRSVKERSTCNECGTEKISPAALYKGICAECSHKPRRTEATYRDKYAEAAGVLEEVLRSQLNETVELDRTFAVEIMEMLRRA